ncbi:hypothetical protein Btru_042977 [Bulinus truncatus]|nr:hypothetical protein Btru_042977 [Bulinus truncatus]
MKKDYPTALYLASLCVIATSSGFVCQKGHYLKQKVKGAETFSSCAPCLPDTFMPHDNHRNLNCQPCTKVERFNHERVVKNCTTTQDTVIGCSKHFFRVERQFQDFTEGDCMMCTDCGAHNMHSARDCDETTDTVCCPEPGMSILKEQNGHFKCQNDSTS